jgi:hypothetical protein
MFMSRSTAAIPSIEEIEEMARLKTALELLVGQVLLLTNQGEVVDPNDYPLLQQFMPSIFSEADFIRLNTELEDLQERADAIGLEYEKHPGAMGRLIARASDIRSQIAVLINEEFADIEPSDVEPLSKGFHPDVFEDLQTAISLGNADSITRENFPSDQPDITYLRFQLMALTQAAKLWKEEKVLIDEADGSELGFLSGNDEDQLDFSQSVAFCKLQLIKIYLKKAELIRQYILDHPDEPGYKGLPDAVTYLGSDG